METVTREYITGTPFGGDSIEDDHLYAVVEETENGLWVWGSGRTPDEAYSAAKVCAAQGRVTWSRDTTDLVEIRG